MFGLSSYAGHYEDNVCTSEEVSSADHSPMELCSLLEAEGLSSGDFAEVPAFLFLSSHFLAGVIEDSVEPEAPFSKVSGFVRRLILSRVADVLSC